MRAIVARTGPGRVNLSRCTMRSSSGRDLSSGAFQTICQTSPRTFSTRWGRRLLLLCMIIGSHGCGSENEPGEPGGESGSAAGGRAGRAAGQGGGAPQAGGTLPTGVAGVTSGGSAGLGNAGSAALGGTGGRVSAGGLHGGTAPGTGGASNGSCSHTCVDRCVESGGTLEVGVCESGGECCKASTPGNPLAHLVPSAKTVGLLLAERFNRQTLKFSSVANLPGDGYKSACEWYGALGVAKLTNSQELLSSLVKKFDPFKTNFVSDMKAKDAHVDRYIFGIVPLEIYLDTADASYLPLGTEIADHQQVTNQTRGAIDDMFMMTGLQLQAYRASQNDKYLSFMAKTMVDYLKAQQPNGLFFHNETQARVHWGRGNGWFAAGMAEVMRDLPATSAHYQTILTGYQKMMDGLRTYQGKNGLWYQVLDAPDHAKNWEESSGSAMFTYAMIAGVRRGVLSAETFVPVIEAAWAGLQSKTSAQGDVSQICVGTWYKANAEEYMGLTRLTGDGHGQAPVLWVTAELLR